MQRPRDSRGDKATRPQHKTTINGIKIAKEGQIVLVQREMEF